MELWNQMKKYLYYQAEFAKSFFYLKGKLNANGEIVAAVTARTRIAWIKFKECWE